MDMAIDTPSPAPPTPPAPSAAAGRQTRAAEAVRLEHQLVRVPLESLRATVRSNHRLAEKEIAAVLSSASAAPAESSAAAVDHLTSLVSRLHGLKRKVPPTTTTKNPPTPASSSFLQNRIVHGLEKILGLWFTVSCFWFSLKKKKCVFPERCVGVFYAF
jgi:hypothetical protein